MRYFEYIREIGSFAWYILASILGVGVKFYNKENPDKKKNILIAYGLGGQSLAFFFLKRYLEKRGFHVYFFNINIFKSLGIGLANLGVIADEIKNFIEINHLEDVTLLGVSAAAAPALLFLENHEGWRHVKKYISLSGAFGGGWMSYVLFFVPIAHEYRPNGWIQKEISHLQLQYPEKITSLFGTWDEMVKPESSKIQNVKNIQLSEGGHAYLQVFSHKTFATIAKIAES